MSKSDPLLTSTLRNPARHGKARATLPTLTILFHPDATRIGQRAALKALLAGTSVEVSRQSPSFGARGGAPLADPHVSRTPFRVHTAPGGAFDIDANGIELSVDGKPLSGTRRVSREELALGVVIELAQSIALLFHLCTHRPPGNAQHLLGQSDAIEDARRELAQVADLEVPVLLRGETGTGKELAAAAIHAQSPRASGPYLAVNMATIAEMTAISTLFGHARGSFTGAHQRHRGLFEQASGGTLLLDEIGETPTNVQPMLLRALETGCILPLGDEQDRAVNVRFIAATDADLERELAEQSFSAALLHRLAGYEIHLPPLRERREDIPLLLLRFMEQEKATMAHRHGANELLGAMVASGFLCRLLRHPLPGNVRQLRNIARHMVISNRALDTPAVTRSVERQLRESIASADSLAVTDPSPAEPILEPAAGRSARTADIDDDALLRALRENAWSPNRAAASLGIPTGTLHDLMRKSPHVRRAADLSDDDIQRAMNACEGDVLAMAGQLRVSERALRLTLRQRGLSPE